MLFSVESDFEFANVFFVSHFEVKQAVNMFVAFILVFELRYLSLGKTLIPL